MLASSVTRRARRRVRPSPDQRHPQQRQRRRQPQCLGQRHTTHARAGADADAHVGTHRRAHVESVRAGPARPAPEGIYRTFEDLLTNVQRVAKDQGYGVVKLRASNYRDGKPTRYDLVCDRGGVKYNSTAKKRNPSTRKVDCPWRAKAVCEVNLNNQWRFAMQEHRHNHEARVPAAPPGQENTPIAQSIRSLTNKLDRIGHDLNQGFNRMEQRIDGIEKRLVDMEQRMISMEARMTGMETRGGEMEVPMDNMAMEGSMLGTAVM
ncbi:uncharacterized protein PG986_008415 [Apiospora aurea]|uniref:FAR1 domain-containing protein n=1 Tax=Apiospora aurea TaxID=335848 RepID=A0ABR1QFE7_9PEZI